MSQPHDSTTRNTARGYAPVIAENLPPELVRYLAHIFGDARFYSRFCTLNRAAKGDGSKAGKWNEVYLPHIPGDHATVAGRIEQAALDQQDAYLCAHGYVNRLQPAHKPNAAQITCLWVERDAATIPPDVPAPTMTIETSPGRFHDYWRLSRSVSPEIGEDLNRRLTNRIGGDSGWALTKRLRPPGSRNFKYPGAPKSKIIAIDDDRMLDPDELERILPKVTYPSTPTRSAISLTDANPDDSEPPVVLTPAALSVWRGERPVMKDGGEVDRSESLYRIACELWEHGATRRTVAAELAARDQALEWNRYTDRPAEYDRLAAKVETKPRKIGPLQTHPQISSASDIDLARELERTRSELADLRFTHSNMVRTFLNPNLTQAEKITLIASINTAQKKQELGEVRPDGAIELTPAEISDDWRSAPNAGESVQPTNRDGTLPRMNRKHVKQGMQSLVDRGLISATPRSVTIPRSNGAPYRDTVWDVDLTEKPANILSFAAAWKPDQPKQRKPRSTAEPCMHCGEIHPIHRQDVCMGCGGILREIEIQPESGADVDNVNIAAESDYQPSLVTKNSRHIDSVVSPLVTKNRRQGDAPILIDPRSRPPTPQEVARGLQVYAGTGRIAPDPGVTL